MKRKKSKKAAKAKNPQKAVAVNDTAADEKKQEDKNAPFRRWCFTLYPEQLEKESVYDKEEVEQLSESEASHYYTNTLVAYIVERCSSARGILLAMEKGDSKEHAHFQGYMELSSPSRFTSIQKAIGCGIHLEKARGTRDENYNYIFHEGDHKEKGELLCAVSWGEWPDTSGCERGAYDQAVNLILEGHSILYVARKLGGAVLPQIGNLHRLQREIEIDKVVESTYIRKKVEAQDEWLQWQKDNSEVPF